MGPTRMWPASEREGASSATKLTERLQTSQSAFRDWRSAYGQGNPSGTESEHCPVSPLDECKSILLGSADSNGGGFSPSDLRPRVAEPARQHPDTERITAQ